jgi:RNA recognition motif-containing protein
MPVRLFVGNLPYDTTDEEIRQHFSPVGNLSYVSIPLDRETGKKRGFAFVEFADAAQAQEAIRQFNNQPFKGRPLAVNEARAREAGPRPAGGFRPSPGPRVGGPPMRPHSDFGDPGAAEPRADRPARKNFGPDAKPARSRSKFKPEGQKKAFKEKFTGQIFGVDDEDDGKDIEIDNFATGLDQEEKK